MNSKSIFSNLNRKLSQKKEDVPLYSGFDESREHILVCLSSAPSNERVIRTAAKMAKAFHGSFTALYVEPPASRDFYPRDRERLNQHLKLAEELGARIATVYGTNAAIQIAEYAKASGITKIVAGKSNIRRSNPFTQKDLSSQLVKLAPEIELYIIPDGQPLYRSRYRNPKETFSFSVFDCLKSLLVIAAASAVGYLFYRVGLSDANIIMVYILGVLLTAICTDGRFYSILYAFCSVVIFNFLFTEPRFSLFAYDADYPVTFLIMLIAGVLAGSLTRSIKLQAKQAAYKAYRTEVLLETSQILQNAGNEEEILQCTSEQLFKLLDRPVCFANQVEDRLVASSACPGIQSDKMTETLLSEKEAVLWVFQNNKHAGATTTSYAGSENLYLAVRGKSNVLSVACFAADGYPAPEAFEKNMMLTILDECGLALEKERISREKQQAELAVQQESLRANLLRSISHDLRTPLTGILGNVDILLENEALLGVEKRRALYTDIYDDSVWLLNLVENLLSVTRLENGTMHLKQEAELIDDIFHDAISHFDRRSSLYHITTSLSGDLLMAWMDARLIIQVIINLVNNAIKYTPPGSHILLCAEETDDHQIKISVTDDGPGIPADARAQLFTMFYTVNHDRSDGRRGLGLGLFLCKSIVTAHGGSLWMEDNHPCGCIFSFTLPKVEVTSNE